MDSAVEHGDNRTQYAYLIDRYYRVDYEAIFGPYPSEPSWGYGAAMKTTALNMLT